MIYRRKSQKRKEVKPIKNDSQPPMPKKTQNPKKQRLIQVEAEIQELAHKSG